MTPTRLVSLAALALVLATPAHAVYVVNENGD